MDFSGLHHLNELKAEWQQKSKIPTAVTTTSTTTGTAADADLGHDANGHNSDPPGPLATNGTVSDRDNQLSQLINNKQYIELQQCEHKDVVIIAKHLCGAATDLAIRSLLAYKVDDKATGTIRSASGSSNTNGSSGSSGGAISSDESSEQGVVLDARAKGCAIATCCHHVSHPPTTPSPRT